MAKKTISVKVAPKKGNALTAGEDGLFATQPTFYVGTCDEQGEGLYPTDWQKASHKPGSGDGYVIFPHPDLVREGYSVVCTPRVDKTKDAQHQTMDLPPVCIFVHTLEAASVHIQVVDGLTGKPKQHAFTWMLIAAPLKAPTP